MASKDSHKNMNLLSCRSREMNTDLLPILRRLQVKEEKDNFSLHTFIRDLEKSTAYPALQVEGINPDSKQICLCNDLALHQYLPESDQDHRHALLVTMNNYYFQLALQADEFKENKRVYIQKFNQLYLPNQFVYNMLHTFFQIRRTQKVEIISNPFIWKLNQQDQADLHKKKFLTHFPQAKDKKILFVMLPNQITEDARESMGQFSIDEFVQKTRGEWVIVTNSTPLLEQINEARSESQAHLIYLKKQYPLENLLYFSDLLITDVSFFAAAQAGRGKAFYCIKHNNNAFEKYMEKYYPALILSGMDDMDAIAQACKVADEDLSQAHASFYQQFTCPLSKEDPAEIIAEKLIKL